MKKVTYLAAILAASMTLSSCMTAGGGNGAAAGTGTALTGAAANSLIQNGGNILGSLMSTLLGGATTNKQSIVGTWTYKAPEVRFESENILSQIGGTMVSNKIQTTLESQLSKLGFKAGKSTFTFNSDGTMVATMGSKKTTGTYTFNSSNHTITMTGALGLTNTTCTVAVTGNTMYLLFDSSKLLSIATTLSKASSTTSTLSSLLGNYKGLKLGWSMTK